MPIAVIVIVRGPRVVSPPMSSIAVRLGEREEARGERREPRLVGVGQREREQKPARIGAHRREVGEVHRERLVARAGAASAPGRKCVPSASVSVVTRERRGRVGAAMSAQSSPTPSTAVRAGA